MLTVFSDINKHSQHLSVLYGCKTVTGDCSHLSNRKKKMFRLLVRKQLKNNADIVIQYLNHLHEHCNCIETPFSSENIQIQLNSDRHGSAALSGENHY